MSADPFAQNHRVSRRDALLSGIAVAATASSAIADDKFATNSNLATTNTADADDRRQSPKEYSYRKSINLNSMRLATMAMLRSSTSIRTCTTQRHSYTKRRTRSTGCWAD